MTTYKDMDKKTDAELATIVAEQREVLRAARFSAAGAGASELKKVREAKKEVARALTLLNARKRSESNNNA